MERKSVLSWRKSSYSGANGGQCVEVAARGFILVRDSKNPHGPVLEFAPKTWRKFAVRIKNNAS
jgi:Domain of unknown function (DUF397)